MKVSPEELIEKCFIGILVLFFLPLLLPGAIGYWLLRVIVLLIKG